MDEIIRQVFQIRPLSEEQNDFIVTVGKHLATKKHFKSKSKAEKYMRTPKWDTVFALLSEVVTNINKMNDGENEKTSR